MPCRRQRLRRARTRRVSFQHRAWARIVEPLRRLRSAARAPKPFRPDLSDRGFFERLRPASPTLQAARQHGTLGEVDAARHAVVDHFLHRRTPCFFVAPDAISGLAQRLRQEHAPWVEALCARVQEERTLGLRLMARRHSPLGPAFQWVDIPRGPGGDSLYSAQPHRFGFLPRLALAAHHGVETLPAIASLLDGWIDAAGQGEPECYHSPLAVLYRVLALSWAWIFVAGLDRETPLRERVLFVMLKILSVDIVYLSPTIGQSYPNNHLLADGFAGWYVGTLYPELALAADCKARGEPLFITELARQFLVDGSNFEHSTHYHELGCEMATAYVLLSRRNGIEPPASVLGQLRAMLRFHAIVGGPEAQPLLMGDSTDDPLFPLDVDHAWANAALRECYRALFDPTLPPSPSARQDAERAYWLLGGALAAPPPSPTAECPMADFEQGGLHVMNDAATQARLIYRSGPVAGVAISAGHANADIHSLTLSQQGRRLIVGAGTYTYRLHRKGGDAEGPDWRAYFAGPEAHNGLLGGGDPLGEIGGDFRNRDVDCRVAVRRRADGDGLSWIESEVLSGALHRGHRRGVVLVRGAYWLVYDIVPPALRERGVQVGLQFDAGVRLLPQAGDARLVDAFVQQDQRCRIALSQGLQPAEVLEGSSVPLGGWIAPRYGHLVAAPQLRARLADPDQPPALLIQPAPQGEGCVIADAWVDADRLCWRIVEGDHLDELHVPLGEFTPPAATALLSWRRSVDGTKTERRQVVVRTA